MKFHTKVYMLAFGYTIADFMPCEMCGAKAVDVHHIENRKSGGDPLGEKDKIQNLMGLCRNCHVEFGDVVKAKSRLKKLHLKFMADNGVK